MFFFPQNDSSGEYERNRDRDSLDRVELIKLPTHSTNGSVPSASSTFTTSNISNSDVDAPLNLSLKPSSTSGGSPIHSSSQPLSQLSNLSQSLLASDRTCKFYLHPFILCFDLLACSLKKCLIAIMNRTTLSIAWIKKLYMANWFEYENERRDKDYLSFLIIKISQWFEVNSIIDCETLNLNVC